MHELIRLTASRRRLRHKTNLPEGYRLVKRGDKIALINPHGKQILAGSDAWSVTSDLEEAAWRDAWREIEQRVKQEMLELKTGTREIKDLERLPQYLRLLDAVNESGADGHHVRRRLRNLPPAVVSLGLFLAGATLLLLAQGISSVIRHQA